MWVRPSCLNCILLEKMVEAKASTRVELEELRAFAAELELATLAAEGELFERGAALGCCGAECVTPARPSPNC